MKWFNCPHLNNESVSPDLLPTSLLPTPESSILLPFPPLTDCQSSFYLLNFISGYAGRNRSWGNWTPMACVKGLFLLFEWLNSSQARKCITIWTSIPLLILLQSCESSLNCCHDQGQQCPQTQLKARQTVVTLGGTEACSPNTQGPETERWLRVQDKDWSI